MTTAQSQTSVVDSLYEDFQSVMEKIDVSEVSLRTSVEDVFQKSLAVAIGSYFERRVTGIVLEFVEKSSGNNVLVSEFVRNKAIHRQYHTYFQWGRANANQFFGLFGKDFRDHMTEYVRNNPEYGDYVSDFMQIGDIRNNVAHDYEYVVINQNTHELHKLYQNARVFVDGLPLRFEEFERSRASEQA